MMFDLSKYTVPSMRDIYVYPIGSSNSVAHHLQRIYDGTMDKYDQVMSKER
jgi:hypothetical protein